MDQSFRLELNYGEKLGKLTARVPDLKPTRNANFTTRFFTGYAEISDKTTKCNLDEYFDCY